MTRATAKSPLRILGLTAGLVFAATTTSVAAGPATAQATHATPLTATTVTASATLGSVEWTLNSNGVLELSEGALPSGQILSALGIPANDIKAIEFTGPGKTVLPADSTLLFAGLGSLETITNMQNLDTSNVTNMTGMFRNSKLTDVDFSGWNTSNVTNMTGMFMLSNTTALDISDWDTSNVTNMTSMFHGLSSLKQLDLSGWDTSNVTNMGQMFFNAQSLTQVELSGWDTSNVTNMNQMFLLTTSLTDLDVTNWNTGNVTDMSAMFDSASALTQLDVSNWNTSNVTEMGSLFSGASALTQLDLSNWDTTSVESMSRMFSGVPLEQLVLGNNVLLNADIGLRNHQEDETFTGNWIEIGSNTATNPGEASWVGDAQALQERYTAAPAPSGTYVAQRKATVTFDSNLTDATGSQDDLTGATGENLTIPESNLAHPSKTFISWNTASDGSGKSYLPGDVLFPHAGTVTLYAQWENDSEPTNPPVEPTNPPVEPTNPPVEPTNPPVDQGVLPTEPTTAPVDQGVLPTEMVNQQVSQGVLGSTKSNNSTAGSQKSALAQTGAAVTGLALISAALIGAGTWAARRRRSW